MFCNLSFHKTSQIIRSFCSNNHLHEVISKLGLTSPESFSAHFAEASSLHSQQNISKLKPLIFNLLSISQSLSNPSQETAEMLKSLGKISSELKEYEHSTHFYIKAYNIFIQSLPGTINQSFYCGIEIARKALISNNFFEAEKYLKNLFIHVEDLKDKYLKALYYGVLGRTMHYLNDYENAIKYFEISLNVFSKLKKNSANSVVLGIFSYELGISYYYKNEFGKALTAYFNALDVFCKENDH